MVIKISSAKKAQFSGIAWFFAIITLIFIFILFFFNSALIGESKKVSISSSPVTARYYDRLDSLWDLSSFLLFQEGNLSNEAYYLSRDLYPVDYVPYTSFREGYTYANTYEDDRVNRDNWKRISDLLNNYTEIYSLDGLGCAMFISGDYYSGKSCFDSSDFRQLSLIDIKQLSKVNLFYYPIKSHNVSLMVRSK